MSCFDRGAVEESRSLKRRRGIFFSADGAGNSLSDIDRSREKSVKGFRAKSGPDSNARCDHLPEGHLSRPTRAATVTRRKDRTGGAGDAIESPGDCTAAGRSMAVFFILRRAQALLLRGKSSSLRSLTIQNEHSAALAMLYAGGGLGIVLADDGNWAEQLMYAKYIDR